LEEGWEEGMVEEGEVGLKAGEPALVEEEMAPEPSVVVACTGEAATAKEEMEAVETGAVAMVQEVEGAVAAGDWAEATVD